MNGSRGVADRIKVGAENKIAVGRVMTCVQTMIVDREDEINNFVPSTSYGVSLLHTNGLAAQLYEPVKIATDNEKEKAKEQDESLGIIYFNSKEEADKVIDKLSAQSVVKEIDVKTIRTNAPKLYKLATIQIEAAKYGYSAQNTLDIIQNYMKHTIMYLIQEQIVKFYLLMKTSKQLYHLLHLFLMIHLSKQEIMHLRRYQIL